MIILSILICTVTGREEYLKRLLDILTPQLIDGVEILILKDDAVMTIGDKRNCLLNQAGGEYICFIDDDDLVATNYIQRITGHLRQKKYDSIGFWTKRIVDGKPDKRAKHSMEYKEFDNSGRFYKRPINHLNPVRTSLAKKVMFLPMSFGEDSDYAIRLAPLLTSSHFIDDNMYIYELRTEKPELPIPQVNKA